MNHSQDQSIMTPSQSSDAGATAGDESATGGHQAPARLPNLRVLHFEGSDCAAFLQGYLTCDSTGLKTDQACPGALCNLQGRTVANGWVWGGSTDIYMLVAASVVEFVGNYIEPYRRFSRTTLLEPARPLAVSPGTSGAIQIDSNRALTLPETNNPETGADATRLWQTLAFAAREICIGAASSGQFLPQMLGLIELGAVDFDKGCYLGQEVVARAQHRGSVKRTLYQAQLVGAGVGELGDGDELSDANGRWRATLINVIGQASDRASALLVAGRDLAGTTQTWRPPAGAHAAAVAAELA